MTNDKSRAAVMVRTAGIAVAWALLAAPAQATNGYIANGYGGGSKGLAGAGVAVPTGVLGLAQNPAMGLKVGNQAGFCLTTFAPERGFETSGAGPLSNDDYKSENPIFFIPCGGANFQLNERSTLGLFVFGNGGMNTEYKSNVFSAFGGTPPLGVNLEQLFISANYSYQVNDRLTFGIAPVVAIQRFSATGLEPFDNAFFSSDPGKVTNNGDDWSTGGGFNFGLLYEPTSEWDIGLAYRSRMYMEPFNKYSGLFAEQGDFDIPAVATLGAAYTPAKDDRLTITAEYQRIFYSDVAAIANSNATADALFAGLGNDDGAGFGWGDMDVVRVGAIYRPDDKWTLRGGLSYASQFTDKEEALLNVLAPATPQWHASVGASYKVNDRWGITGSFTHAFSNTVTGTNDVLAPNQAIDLKMVQNEFALGATYRW
ncbi:OmpP1/FadL family transporter [Actibacterium lipolyticum]|uniref:Long-chain fatty acid outer membrane transporter n=1 Tax=Actibacterium lipolyticum TaxID=1524263 RepID=A0A238JWY5_9RHOB|nr:outer membrane protein transport protein [Actibacterium lipolyticum]SMX35168.1 long-chain fatty acid outer membrane transporter [Actibacterium lipolyticum]